MAQFPQQIKAKVEIQEKTNNIPLSHVHLTTMNFGETNVALYRHNTPREKYKADISVFARPFPIQTPVMAAAEHHLKLYYVPFRVLSPQWNAFINKSPHIPYNGNNIVQVNEMPYFTTGTLFQFIINTLISTNGTASNFDFQVGASQYKLLTPFGRYCVKVLMQLGYDIIMDDKQATYEHIDAMGLLAYAKVYLDFYYNSAYYNATTEFIQVNQLFLKDANTAYELTAQDLINIFTVCRRVFYNESMITAAWDNPMAPNNWGSLTTIALKDITLNAGNGNLMISNGIGNDTNGIGTPRIGDGATNAALQTYPLTQYAIDSLKKMTDYCMRFAMSGVREVDRYLSRFGVLLSSEKMKRSIYYGEQITPMEFGAVYSTAATSNANIGDYAGQSIINSDNKEHKHFEIESDEYGIIIGISTIIPKVNYFQGIDRNNLHKEVETYFSGIFDQLGTAAISQAEVLVSTKLPETNLQGNTVLNAVYGHLPRGYEYKIPRDRLTGDFRINHLLDSMAAWHLFRILKSSDFATNGIKHSPDLTKMTDAQQYLRIFDNTSEEDGDHFNVIYQIKASADVHAKPLYESYDFESEGKEIMLNGNGPKQN